MQKTLTPEWCSYIPPPVPEVVSGGASRQLRRTLTARNHAPVHFMKINKPSFLGLVDSPGGEINH